MGRKPGENEVKDANRRLHRAIAAEYDDRQAIYHPAVMRGLRSLVTPHIENRGGRALDAGCGTGFVRDLLGETGFEFFSFDLTEEMVRRAKSKRPDAAYAVADAFSPPFAPESFDLLAVSGVLHHVVNYVVILERLLALVKSGGIVLILNEPNARGYDLLAPVRPFTRALLPEQRVRKHIGDGSMRAGDEAAAEYQTHYGSGVYPEKVASILAECGFGIAKLEYTNLNMIANIGDRVSVDLIKKIPLLARLPAGKYSPDFNIVARKK